MGYQLMGSQLMGSDQDTILSLGIGIPVFEAEGAVFINSHCHQSIQRQKLTLEMVLDRILQLFCKIHHRKSSDQKPGF